MFSYLFFFFDKIFNVYGLAISETLFFMFDILLPVMLMITSLLSPPLVFFLKSMLSSIA